MALTSLTVDTNSSPGGPQPGAAQAMLWSVFATAFTGLGAALPVIIAAHVSTVEMVGQLGLALAIAGPLMTLAGFSLRPVQITESDATYEVATYAAARAGAGVVGVCCVAGVCVGSAPWIAVTAVLIAAARGLEALSDVAHGHLQRENRMNLASLSVSVRVAAGLGLFWAGLRAGARLDVAAAGLVVGALIAIVTVDAPLVATRALWRAVRAAHIRHVVRLALPVAVAGFLAQVIWATPRFFLTGSELGVFTGLLQIPLVVVTLAGALSGGALVSLKVAAASATALRHRLLRSGGLVVAAVLAASGCLALLRREAVSIALGPAFAAHAGQLSVLLGVGVLEACSGFIGVSLVSCGVHAGRGALFMGGYAVGPLIVIAGCLGARGDVTVDRAGWLLVCGAAAGLVVRAVLLAVVVRSRGSVGLGA